jgi:regulator of sigma E protease
MEIIKFIIILLILVTVHELGHFLFAKLFNVYVSEFALGFGPTIFSHQGKETKFSIRLLPLGGYAAMVGEDGVIDERLKHIPYERTVKGVNRFKQFLIMFGGSFMNILFALFLFIVLAFNQATANPNAIVGSVDKNSPAAQAGLKVDDKVVKIIQNKQETKVANYTDLTTFSALNKKGEAFTLVVDRAGKTRQINVKPKYNKTAQAYQIGIRSKINPPATNIIDGIKNGYLLFNNTKDVIFSSLQQLLTGKVGVDQMAGPVGILQMTGQVDQAAGTWGLVSFAAMLSLNLAIFNLLPIPALDGGRILILLIEAITRKKLKPSLEEKIMLISFSLLMLLVIYVTFNDIARIFFK